MTGEKPNITGNNITFVYFYNFNALLTLFKQLDIDFTNFNNNTPLTKIIILTVNEGTQFNYPNYIKDFLSFINKWFIKLLVTVIKKQKKMI